MLVNGSEYCIKAGNNKRRNSSEMLYLSSHIICKLLNRHWNKSFQLINRTLPKSIACNYTWYESTVQQFSRACRVLLQSTSPLPVVAVSAVCPPHTHYFRVPQNKLLTCLPHLSLFVPRVGASMSAHSNKKLKDIVMEPESDVQRGSGEE